ncbi:MAG: hypothetical protein ACOC2J_03510, partial [bacterium]
MEFDETCMGLMDYDEWLWMKMNHKGDSRMKDPVEMDRKVKVMNEINEKFLLDEKILIVPSYTMGRQLLHSFAECGIVLLNLNLKTISGLAVEYYERYLYDDSNEIIGSDTGRLLIYNILNSLKKNDQLVYFNELQITAGISNAIYNTLHEIRMAGYSAEDMATEYFISADKAEDIGRMLSLYEKELQERSYLDTADIFRILVDKFKGIDSDIGPDKDIDSEIGVNRDLAKSIYIIPSNLEVNYLEREFLNLLFHNNEDINE